MKKNPGRKARRQAQFGAGAVGEMRRRGHSPGSGPGIKRSKVAV